MQGTAGAAGSSRDANQEVFVIIQVNIMPILELCDYESK